MKTYIDLDVPRSIPSHISCCWRIWNHWRCRRSHLPNSFPLDILKNSWGTIILKLMNKIIGNICTCPLTCHMTLRRLTPTSMNLGGRSGPFVSNNFIPSTMNLNQVSIHMSIILMNLGGRSGFNILNNY